MKLNDIQQLEVKGFLDEQEGIRLSELAGIAGRIGPCLEIGGYCGKSALYLGYGCKMAGSVLFSIDHHRGSEEQQLGEEYFDPDLFDEKTGKVDTFRIFRETIEKACLEDTVIPVVTQSKLLAKWWQTPLGMVFIDGGHSYSSAFSDYTSWMPHILPGGILAVHDIFADANEGGQAPHLVYNMALDSGLFEELPMVGTLGALKRRGIGEVPEDIANRRDW